GGSGAARGASSTGTQGRETPATAFAPAAPPAPDARPPEAESRPRVAWGSVRPTRGTPESPRRRWNDGRRVGRATHECGGRFRGTAGRIPPVLRCALRALHAD